MTSMHHTATQTYHVSGLQWVNPQCGSLLRLLSLLDVYPIPEGTCFYNPTTNSTLAYHKGHFITL